MEYDGYALHRLRIVPPAAQSEIANPQSKIDGLRLLISLKPEEATHLHATAGDYSRIACRGLLSSASPASVPVNFGSLPKALTDVGMPSVRLKCCRCMFMAGRP